MDLEGDRVQRLTHLDASGRAHMVNVSDKPLTVRIAKARAVMSMLKATLITLRSGAIAKGDVLAVAQVAAVMGAKKTQDVIPMCHPILISGIDVEFSFPDECTLVLDVTVRTTGQTGVEMEAMTAASIGVLTVYDMCKAIDRAMTVTFIGLLEKDGGKSGHFTRQE